MKSFILQLALSVKESQKVSLLYRILNTNYMYYQEQKKKNATKAKYSLCLNITYKLEFFFFYWFQSEGGCVDDDNICMQTQTVAEI